MKKLLSLSFLAAIMLFGACKKSSGPSNNASVMFVYGCSGINGNLSVTANNTPVPSAQNLTFLGTSGYQNITSGSAVPISFNILGTTSGSTAPLTSGTASFTTGTDYSVFASGSTAALSVFYTTDDLSAPASGNAKIRLVNLSSDNLSLTGTTAASGSTTTNMFASGVNKTSISGFAQMPAGTYKILVEDTTHATATSYILPSQVLTAGKIYTILYTGINGGGGSFGYIATVITNK